MRTDDVTDPRRRMDGERAAVELRIPADGAYIPMLRTLTAGLAARCDLTLDQIEDLRIAVDEACALLLPHVPADAAGDIWLAARFHLSPGRLDVVASVPAEAGAEPDRDGLGWTVLSALADDVAVDTVDGELAITLRKHRDGTPALHDTQTYSPER